MNCPFCNSVKPLTIRTRRSRRNVQRRTKRCRHCGKQFFTVEAVVPANTRNLLSVNEAGICTIRDAAVLLEGFSHKNLAPGRSS